MYLNIIGLGSWLMHSALLNYSDLQQGSRSDSTEWLHDFIDQDTSSFSVLADTNTRIVFLACDHVSVRYLQVRHFQSLVIEP